MGFENLDNNNSKANDDVSSDILLASAFDGAKEAFLAKQHGGSRVEQPGVPQVPGKIYIPNPNDVQHHPPHSTLSASPGTIQA